MCGVIYGFCFDVWCSYVCLFLCGNFRLVIRSATIEEIEAEKSAIESDVVRIVQVLVID